jgi:hypothetical protein
VRKRPATASAPIPTSVSRSELVAELREELLGRQPIDGKRVRLADLDPESEVIIRAVLEPLRRRPDAAI